MDEIEMSVIINGGGVSGIILSLVLSKLTRGGLTINLIELFSPNNSFSFFRDSRYIVLSRSSYYKLMSFLDISSILSSCSTSIKKIEIIAAYQKKVIFSASDYHLTSLGYVIKLDNIKMKIFNLLHQLSNIKLFYPARLRTVKQGQFNNLVILDDGSEIFSPLLIAADGSYSSLATLCGMEWDFFDYKQVAVITNVTTSLPNEGRAFEIFTSYGSLALLPIASNKSALIWCIPSSYKNEVLSWSSPEFCNHIQKVFNWRLGNIFDVDERCFFSLFLRKAKYHVSHRLALVGNAAQTVHPIAGQGFNLGFRDILNISEIISKANMKGVDIGNNTVLSRYQKSRQLDQFKIISMTHALVRLFSNSYYPFVFFKNFIFTAMKCSSLLRNVIMNEILNW